MRVTHISLRYPPASGGVEEYVLNLVERLRAAGDDVTVETTNLRTHHPATFLEGPLDDPPYIHRHPVRTLGPIAYPIPRGLAACIDRRPTSRRVALSKVGPPDLVHAHGFWYAPADLAARMARRRQLPFVLNPYYAPRPKWYWRTYRATIGRNTIASADAVVVISPQEASALRADGLPLRRVELIPPGINPSEFSPPRENPFVRRGLGEKRVLFFAGRIARAKGVDVLVRALPEILRAASLDLQLAIAGEDFGDRAELEGLADRLGVAARVSWLGKLSRDELIAAYQHATIFIFPSRHEAFGIAPLEAQAAGCPVVAANTASIPFVVQHEQTGLLFRAEDPHDVAEQVLRLLRDASFAARLAAEGRERAHREFTWEASVRKLRTLYADLLHRGHIEAGPRYTDRT